MKPFSVLFSLLFLSCFEPSSERTNLQKVTFEPSSECANFQTGIFEFETLIEGELVKTTFVRQKAIEIETYRGKKDTASIRWVNECEYILKAINPKNMAEQKPMHFKILTTAPNSYTFEYNIVGENTKQRGTAYKVK
jgi:hypothetical protein